MSKSVAAAAALASGIYAVAAIATPAAAADIPTKAPVYLPTAVYDWTGLYFGLNAGYSIGRHRSSEFFVQPGATPDTTQVFTLAPAGFVGGGQLGYNWQTGHWVAGVEADWQWTGQNDTVCISGCNIRGGLGSNLTVEQKLNWLATLRGRIGYADAGWLWYLTGGGAWAEVKENDSLLLGCANCASVASFSSTKSGWTIGGGVETMLSGNWSAKLEYLYVSLGGMTHSFANVPFPATQTIQAEVRDHIVRVGLNYRIGEAVAYEPQRRASAIYKAPPAAPMVFHWAGIYAGLNTGYSVGRNHDNERQFEAAFPAQPASRQTFTLSPAGGVGGAQLGYNWQVGQLVAGVEGDWQWTGQKDSVCITSCTPGNAAFGDSLSIEQQMRWLATLRARLGYAHGSVLWYVTGGAAWGQIAETVRQNFTIDQTFIASLSHTRAGWTLGGGVETAFAGNWTAKLEYLYVDLGQRSDTFTLIDPTEFQFINREFRDHIIRVGVSYRFGGNTVIANY